ncbi:MAG: SpoVR family protein, partial [bacterium]
MNGGVQVRERRLSQGPDWTFELIDEYEREIRRTAAEFGLDTYPNQIEVITS